MLISKLKEKFNTLMIESEIQARIEAALYASGRPLSPEELALAGRITSKRLAVKITRNLAKIVNSTLRALEIVELEDNRFVMQLRNQFLPIAKKFSIKPLLPDSMLKTLSYVAYFQPISRIKIAEQRGNHVYKHLKTLEKLGFISGESSQRTKIYRTTISFSDYFGLSKNPKIMKDQLKKMGFLRTKKNSEN